MVTDVSRVGLRNVSIDIRVPEAEDVSVSCVGKYTRQARLRFLGPSFVFETQRTL